MDLVIGLLTFVLVLTCLLLVLLILVQLPKKEAGAGVAFGGAATDALFGSGTGTALSKLTRHASVFFLCLAFGLSVLQAYSSKSRRSAIMDRLGAQTAAPAAPAATVPGQAPNLGLSNAVQSTVVTVPTNAEAAVTIVTNAAAAAATATTVATNIPAVIPTNAPAPAPGAQQ